MKIKVGVFFGGDSVEHEVSVISGIQAIAAFDKNKYEPVPVYITKGNELYAGPAMGDISRYRDIPALLKEGQRVFLLYDNGKCNLMKYPVKKFGNPVYDYIDVAFPVVHGANVEDGSLQGFLRHYNIPFSGCDVCASAVAMDKYVTKAVCRDQGIPVLDCCLVDVKRYQREEQQVLAQVEEKLSYPVIVKPVDLGSSVGIKIAADRAELADAVTYAFDFTNRIMIEPAVVNLREINCAVLGDYEKASASECEEPVSSGAFLSYEDKYVQGAKGGVKSTGSGGMAGTRRELPAKLAPEVRETIRSLAVKTFQAIGCSGVARIDFIIDQDDDQIYVNEINPIPGSLSFYLWEAAGKQYTELLDDMVKLALKRQREREGIAHSFDTNILATAKLGGTKGLKS